VICRAVKRRQGGVDGAKGNLCCAVGNADDEAEQEN